ncbi:phage head-tail joining protein [Bartonella bovis]|uniref:Putative phage related protein n=2 Tax=Bartonella bovis TaxID=155194 RepID=N6ULP2_9HYPH|nr:hypothetical protein [Bartonella bovis]ENN91133.1 putative phage related protein [Bartonella bovis 91-4]ENN92708.1 putative phage related protein [Bartonella bovis 91-4]
MYEKSKQVNSKYERLAELKKQRKQLENALYSGAQSVRHGDKQVNHRSTEDIRKALTMLREEIALLEGYKPSYVYYLTTSRGY